MVTLAIGLLLTGPVAEASAQSPEEARWRSYSRAMAAPWPAIQRDTGNLPDYLDGLNNPFEGTRYGDAMIGWGLLQVGLRDRDDRLVSSGLRAIDYATNKARTWHRPSVFETMAVASSYNLVKKKLAGDGRFEKIRGQWENWLKRVRTKRLQYVNKYGNHWLVDAISVFELQRTGLKSTRRGAVLGGGRTTARRQAIRLVNIRVPRLVRGRGPFVLSDPPDEPLAYHGLSIAFYARAMKLMGGRVAPAARTTLRRAVRASQILAAPDGDLSYFGRSQEEIWTLPATAYAAVFAAEMPGSSAALKRGSDALAERSLERLRREYEIGSRGSWITPALAQDLRLGSRALDAYAGAPAYAGLALVWLNFTIAEHPNDPISGRIPADNLLSASLSQRSGRFAVVRRSKFWWAIKLTRSRDPHFVDDLRYDFGLTIAKRQLESGRWTDVVPERPRTNIGEGRSETAGPVLGGVGLPFGSRMSTTRAGNVRIAGGFRTPSFRVLRRTLFTYEPAACGGVRFSFGARARDTYLMSAFFRGETPPTVQGATAAGGSQRVTVDPRPVWARPVDGGASGADARLWRLRYTIRVPVNRRVAVTYC